MTRRPPAYRYAGWVTAGGKLTLIGVGIGAVGGAWLGATGKGPLDAAALARSNSGPSAVASLGLLLIVIGCFVYVIQPVADPALSQQVPFATVRTSLAMFVVAAVVANLLSLPLVLTLQRGVAVGGPGQRQLGALGLTYLIVSSELPILGVLWLRLVKPGLKTWRDLGLRAGIVGEHVSMGLAGGVILFLTAGVVSGALSRVGVHQNQFERFQGIEGAPLGLFILALLAGCVLAPYCEELFFRGYVFQTFLQRRGPWWAYLFSAALFAAVHANIAAAGPIFVLGLILAFIFQRSGSILPGMIAHGLNNAMAFVLLYSGFRG
jgi:membrane protease YdiL (CAAX protease family)